MEYTGIENVYLNGTMIGFSREEIDAKLESILEFADIGEFVYQPVKTYSSGMFVRLAFAVAINIDPEILIVDEALSVGDVFFQAKCYHKFEEFKKLGKTILFVSHDLSSVSKYCDRVILLNQGVKKAEGSPKEMVDLYKKILVHQDEEPVEKKAEIKTEEITGSGLMKDRFQINPEILDYGSKLAEIIDFGLFDNQNKLTNSIEKRTECTIKFQVKFNQDISEPIFAFTIKDLKGTEITGTNSMFEKVVTGTVKKGETRTASFKQKMNLQGGEYLISLGCTGYKDGEFTVYHRLYDAFNMTVISQKNTVGFFDTESEVVVEKK